MSDTPDPELLRLEQAIRNLPRIQREIFLAHRLDDMSYDEIARRTGLSRAKVQHYMARAIYKIVRQMEGEPLSWWQRWF